MRTTIISRHIGWEENNTICLTHFGFYMDSDDDLPTSVYLPTDTPGVQYKIAQGSLAYDLSTSKLYVVNSEGTWVEQAGGGGGGGGGGFTPTEAQLAAMNSGITSADVEQISTNKADISLLNAQPKLYVDDSGYIAVDYGNEN